MSYLKEFQKKINERDFHQFFVLWEEYCTNDTVDAEEFISFLEMVKSSDFSKPFGELVETAIPLYKMIEDKDQSYITCKLLMDLQTTNSASLAEVAISALQERFGQDPEFNERVRLIGLRSKVNFKGAIANYALLRHFKKGAFVFHTAGWGVGEILDVSLLRQQITLELEYVVGTKYLNFENAFNTLIPLQKEHFLVRRFAEPDIFEVYALEHPLETITLLLKDLGSKTASEIKDEICVLVIPEASWSKWWQRCRQQMKRSTEIFVPLNPKDPFYIREEEVSHEKRFKALIEKASSLEEMLKTAYSFIREVPQVLKNIDTQEFIKQKLLMALKEENLPLYQQVEIYVFLDEILNTGKEKKSLADFVKNLNNIENVIDQLTIISSTKRVLEVVREIRADWMEVFFKLLPKLSHSLLREYLLKELEGADEAALMLNKFIKRLKGHPLENPELFFWIFKRAFQLALEKSKVQNFSDKERDELWSLFEAYFILIHTIEHNADYKLLLKKMVQFVISKRYENVRSLLDISNETLAREFLLLSAKCYIFSKEDQQIFRSLVRVIYPHINEGSLEEEEPEFVWMTQEGKDKLHKRMEIISTTEIIENAKEVEVARSHGDLRENAEYKYAVEKRGQLQRELKELSKKYEQARVITSEDVLLEAVGIGNSVDLENSWGIIKQYTILGPVESDPHESIISYKSKIAEAMWGLKLGDSFTFGEESYTIKNIKSFLK
jgi:transcription elongation factor GreA-like protein/transcription elongation GreA/GreB family factor